MVLKLPALSIARAAPPEQEKLEKEKLEQEKPACFIRHNMVLSAS
jgi:hypothetical protein